MRYGCCRTVVAMLGLAGCAAYHPAPLILTPPLKAGLAALARQRPDGTEIPLTSPLLMRDVAALAVLNDPDLAATRAQHGVAQAELLAAGLPPDPTLSAGFAALISGPGSVPAISSGLAQDVSALITYRVDRRAAKASLAQVDAANLWQEWQVAAQAEQLCVSLAGDAQTLGSLRADAMALMAVNASTQTQVASENMTASDSATSRAALAAVQNALATANTVQAQHRDQLDALLGLQPDIDISVTVGAMQAPSQDTVTQAIATLAVRRPDLIALRYGYASAVAKLRAAILTQFLPLSLGGNAGRDTSNVVSAGPVVTLTLPLFNHNRAGIAAASATRAMLAAQFQASLASATGGALALNASIAQLQAQSEAAEMLAQSAKTDADAARRAFEQGALDTQTTAMLQTEAGERARDAIALNVQLQTGELALATMLGLGLPPLASPQPDDMP